MRALGLVLAPLLLLGAAPAFADPVVVTEDDAVHARAGRDYTRIATVRMADPDEDHPLEVTAGGNIVVQGFDGHDPTFTLLDPGTGRRKALPSPGRRPSLLGITGSTVWYLDSAGAGVPARIYRYDRGADRMRSFRLPVKERDFAEVIGRDGTTIWFATGPRGEDSVASHVRTVRFGRPGTLTSYGRKYQARYADGVLAWTRTRADGVSQVVQRDVATGEVVRTDVPEDCWAGRHRIQGNGALFVTDLTCEDPEQKAIVVDRAGEITTILAIAMEDGPLGTSDRGVFFYDTFYDFATGRLLDISDIGNARISPVSGRGEHPVQVWPQRDGRALVVRLK